LFAEMSPLCPICLNETSRAYQACPTCSDQLDKARCILPLRQTPLGDWVMFAFHYVDLTRDLMLKFKYRKAFYLSRFFAQELWKTIQAYYPWQKSVIVPVPSSVHRLFRRKYQPVELLAQSLHVCSGLPLYSKLLFKNFSLQDREQKGLRTQERMKNPSLSFTAKTPLFSSFQPASVLLLDDVFTSGSTLHACKKAINKTFPELPVYMAAVAHG
jgi:ComF family protein